MTSYLDDPKKYHKLMWRHLWTTPTDYIRRKSESGEMYCKKTVENHLFRLEKIVLRMDNFYKQKLKVSKQFFSLLFNLSIFYIDSFFSFPRLVFLLLTEIVIQICTGSQKEVNFFGPVLKMKFGSVQRTIVERRNSPLFCSTRKIGASGNVKGAF